MINAWRKFFLKDQWDKWQIHILFLKVSGSPQNKHHWTSATNILGFHHPDAGFLVWEAQCGAQTFYSLQRTSAIVIILLFGGRLPKGIGFDYTASPPLLPISLWFLLFFLIFLFVYFWLCWVFIAARAFSSLWCAGFSLRWFLWTYLFFFRIFFSPVGCYKILTLVPCATQWVLVGYLFYIY